MGKGIRDLSKILYSINIESKIIFINKMEQGLRLQRRSPSPSSSSSSSGSRSPKTKKTKTEYESYKFVKPKEIPMKEQEINAKYSELVKYLKQKNFELSETDPKGRKSVAIPKLIKYLKEINKNQKLPLDDKDFIVKKFIVLRDFDRKKYDDFITILNKVVFPEYFDKKLISGLVDDIVVMNKKRDLLNFYNNINNQISKKFDIDPEMSKETIKRFIDDFLIKEGYMSAKDEEYNKSDFSRIVIDYEEGKQKEYKELVKNISDIISYQLKLEEPMIGSIASLIVPKTITKAKKKVGKYVSKKFTELMTGKKVEDVYKPKTFYGPPSTKRIYKELETENIPKVLGDKTIKVRGVKDKLGSPMDLNIHIFNDYEKYDKTLTCLKKATYYCTSFTEDTEEQKVVPCVLDNWINSVEVPKSELLKFVSTQYVPQSILQTEKYAIPNFKQGYIVTRDFGKYQKLSDVVLSPNNKDKVKERLDRLIDVLGQWKVIHGGITDNNIKNNILINPASGSIVLAHFEKCKTPATEAELKEEEDIIMALRNTYSKKRTASTGKESEEEEDISSLRKKVSKSSSTKPGKKTSKKKTQTE